MPNIITAIAGSALSVVGIRLEEEPEYETIDQFGGIDIRRYANRLAAQTTVTATDAETARSDAFKILAGYIFGGNRERRELPMTAPVVTATSLDLAGSLTMQFILPKGTTLETAPAPQNDRIKLVPLEEEILAILRFSGSWDAARLTDMQNTLLTLLSASRWSPLGQTFALSYDPPFTLPPLRRNEAAVKISPRPAP